jgi:hypothetical protein
VHRNLFECTDTPIRITEATDFVLATCVIDDRCLGGGEVVGRGNLRARQEDAERDDTRCRHHCNECGNEPQEDLQW